MADTKPSLFTMTVDYILLWMAGVWISRLLKNRLMDDVFNTENHECPLKSHKSPLK
ncbi:MAG: hypothetical protein LBR65_08685 [Culturomica sp.]|jgi:hypothetical protein|nr:hypothetical protein [Culturomica sp.]